VLPLSSDGINDSPRPWLPGIELRKRDLGDLLAVPVGDLGWAYAGDLTRLDRPWVGARVGTVAPGELMQLEAALRATLDL
jgi:mRNA interferase MazF